MLTLNQPSKKNNLFDLISYQEFKPSLKLSGQIRSYYYLRHPGGQHTPSLQRVTPDGCIEINFNLGSPLLRTDLSGNSKRIEASYITQRFSRSYFIQRTGPVKMIGVRFYPWGIRPFINFPAYLLTDKLFRMDEIFGKDIVFLQEKLAAVVAIHEAIAILENYFMSKYNPALEKDVLVSYACRQIVNSHGDLRLDDLISQLNLSERRVQQKFSEWIGYGAKAFCRLTKFQLALKQLKAMEDELFTDIAYKNNYFDQSHFIREFKYFAGISPKRYRDESHPLNDLVISHL